MTQPFHAPPRTAPQGKTSTARTVGIVVGLGVLGILLMIGLGVLLARGAAKQTANCDAAYAEAAGLVAKSDPGGRQAIEKARSICMSSLKVPELAALEAQAEKNEEFAKTLAAKPAMLAAGYKEEQLYRETMSDVCKGRGFMVVEMVAPNVPGGPHYWDCDPTIPYQEGRQSPESCAAKNLEFGAMQGPDGEPIGVCKRKAAEAPAGLMRIKKDGVHVGATTEALLERAVEIAASGDREAFDKYVRKTPGVALMQPRLQVIIVDTSGFFASRVKVRKKGGTQEVWVLREALESVPSE